MIGLGGIKGFEFFEFGDDGTFVDLRGGELRDVGFGDALLLVGRIENFRAILRAGVWALAIPLRGIVSDGKVGHEKLAVGDLRRIEDDLDAFGVAGDTEADSFVGGRFQVAAGVAGSCFSDALDVFEDGLHSPKTTASEDGRFRGICGGERSVDGWLGNGSGRRGGRTSTESAESVVAKEKDNDG